MIDNISAFNSIEYDAKIKLTLPFYDECYNQIVDIVQTYNSNPLSWLDVGCGTGKMEDVACKNLDIEKFVFCDCSTEMIGVVKKRFSTSNSEFLVSDIQELEYRDEFDVITAIQVNHYFNLEERLVAIQKCYQALKWGGMFISFENFAPFSKYNISLCENCSNCLLRRTPILQRSYASPYDRSFIERSCIPILVQSDRYM